MHLFNTPPLRGRMFKPLPSSTRITEPMIKAYSIELRGSGWANGETEWSKGWGVLFEDMGRTLLMLEKCTHKLYYNR